MFLGCIKKIALGSALLILAAPAWAQRGQGIGRQGAAAGQNCLIDVVAKQELDAKEAAGLTHMREEEKLARDVYAKLYAKWGARVFANISRSEQRHMDAVGRLLDRYGIDDPAADKAAGEFQNPDLQALYSELTAMGETSLAAAFRVGAKIEDLDIYDLEEALAATDNDDLRIVYHNLLRGSQNHMRAFVGQLEALGESYTAQYISETALKDILATGNAAGAGCGGQGNGPRRYGQGNGFGNRNR